MSECKSGAGRERRRLPGRFWTNMGAPSEKPNGLDLGVDAAFYAPHPAVVNVIF